MHLVLHKLKNFSLETLSLSADITAIITIKFSGIPYMEQVMEYTGDKLKFYLNDYA